MSKTMEWPLLRSAQEMTGMRVRQVVALLVLAAFTVGAGAQGKYKDAFKGKIKVGEYELKTEMTGALGKHADTDKQCVTAQDLAEGMDIDTNCEIRNFKSSGNVVSYSKVCTGPASTTDDTVTFSSDGYKFERKDSRKDGGTSTQRVQARYLGPCKN